MKLDVGLFELVVLLVWLYGIICWVIFDVDLVMSYWYYMLGLVVLIVVWYFLIFIGIRYCLVIFDGCLVVFDDCLISGIRCLFRVLDGCLGY